jgi:DNA-binding MarR family transcriptional regulator
MNAPPDTLRSIGYLTNLAGRLLVRALERRIPGGSAGPMPVFLALSETEALPQKALAKLAAVEQPTMANTLARMQRDGLVVGTPDPNDRRSTLMSLTPLGRERAQAAMQAAGAVNALALGALTPAERPMFIDMLGRVIARLEGDA